MSNHSEMRVVTREPDVGAIRRRCRDRLDQVRNEHIQFAAQLRQQSATCDQMASKISQLRNIGKGIDMSLNNLSYDISSLETNLRNLSTETASLASQIEETAAEGSRVLNQAHAENRQLSLDQQGLQNRVNVAASEAHQIALRIESVTKELDRQMREANRIVDAIERSKEKHNVLDREIDRDLDGLHAAARTLQGIIGQWVDVSSQLSTLNLNVDSSAQEMQALAEALHRSPALYALLENLRDYRFEHIEMFENGLTAFFVDEEGRRVTITSQTTEKEADDLLEAIQVSIDLDNFDVEGEHEICDEELTVLTDMDGAVIVESQIETPKKAPGKVPEETLKPPASTSQQETGRQTA